MRRFILCLSISIISALPMIVTAQEPQNTHTVAEGENLYRIALNYGFTVDELALANGITDPSTIYVGQVLLLPSLIGGAEPVAEQPPVVENATNVTEVQDPVVDITEPAADVETAPITTEAPAIDGPVIHIVQANEGLSTIARAYGVSWVTIANANGITEPNLIYAGQELTIPDPTTQPPADYGQAVVPIEGRQIIVDLSDQTIYAYEGDELVHQVTVSTGLPGTPTVTGEYTIYSKLPSQTMYGPGYYLPGVPWVMYFYQGYAIHGTYWHSNFGQPMSHGCVNLPSEEAEWFFEFAQVGTPVIVNP